MLMTTDVHGGKPGPAWISLVLLISGSAVSFSAIALVVAVSCVGSCKDLKVVDKSPSKWTAKVAHGWGLLNKLQVAGNDCSRPMRKAVLFCKGERTLFKLRWLASLLPA
jgi:hypothetical protein